MWLINTTSLELEGFMSKPPRYAILSHRWANEKDEICFKEWHEDHARIEKRPGYVKIVRACQQARADELGYIWVDTICIDKSSSAELSEAINSMYQYYSNAMVCYAYLCDVNGLPPDGPASPDSEFRRSAWFTRGWTLQELLAPSNLVFFDASWAGIGTKSHLCDLISEITNIESTYLLPGNVDKANISCRMSWVSNRITSRLEDIAYCMLGIFGINMPLLYGEGRQAFRRLQEELVKSSNDQTIFAWDWLPRDMETSGCSAPRLRAEYLLELGWKRDLRNFRGRFIAERTRTSSCILSPDPLFFYNSGGFQRIDPDDYELQGTKPYAITNLGLSISLPLYRLHNTTPRHNVRRSKVDGLVIIEPCRIMSAKYDFPALDIDWVNCLGFRVSISNGYPSNVLRRADLPMDAPSGGLLSFSIPGHLFKRYFPTVEVFVPGPQHLHICQEEQPDEFELGVLSLQARNAPAFNCIDEAFGEDQHGRKTRLALVFEVHKGPEWLGHSVLVRAYRSPNNGGDIHWDCRETEEIRNPTYGWAFEGKKLSLDEIMELDENECSHPWSTAYVWDAKMSDPPRGKFQIRLDGEIKRVSKPGCCMTFLHAIPLLDEQGVPLPDEHLPQSLEKRSFPNY